MSSQLLGIVLKAHKQCRAAGGTLKVCKVRPEVAEIFAITNVERVLEIYPDEWAALESDWPEPSPQRIPLPLETVSEDRVEVTCRGGGAGDGPGRSTPDAASGRAAPEAPTAPDLPLFDLSDFIIEPSDTPPEPPESRPPPSRSGPFQGDAPARAGASPTPQPDARGPAADTTGHPSRPPAGASPASGTTGGPAHAAGQPIRPAGALRRVRLRVLVGRDKGKAVEVHVPRFFIGRDLSCHLWAHSPIVSRFHALIEQRGGRVFLRDLGSSNGTRLGDRMLQKVEEIEVADGHRLQIGPMQFTFRNGTCKNNLRQFGIGLHTFADNHSEYFCTGASDWVRDGAFTEVGWMADLVNQGIPVGQMLCPSNQEVRMTEKYNDLLGVTSSGDPSCGVDPNGTAPSVAPDGSPIINACRLITGEWTGTWVAPWGTTYTGGPPLPPGSEERRQVVEEMIWKPGYNSNYVSSWWLARSGIKLDTNGNLVNPFGGSCPVSPKERACTMGPLSRRLVDNGPAPSSNIPLLGDTAPGDIREAVLTQRIGDVPVGARLGEAFTDGPVENPSMKQPTFTGAPTGTPFATWWGVWNNRVAARRVLQDYRDFGPVHGARGARTANILMADGSVKSFQDTNKDNYLNNGFNPLDYTGPGSIGYTSAEVELPSQEIYSGYTLQAGTKGNLDRN